MQRIDSAWLASRIGEVRNVYIHLYIHYICTYICIYISVLKSEEGDLMSVKGKAVPLQAWSDPEGSRKLTFPDFVTTAQDGGKVVSPTHRPPLPPGNTPRTHIC